MRFGFKTSPQNTTWSDMLDTWRAGDDIDVFESGWTFDHFYPIFSDSTGPCMEGWTITAALAQATTRIRIGVLVTGIHYRHPAVLANMASAVDIISDGRLELGLGAGWNEEESDAYGIELGTMTERFDRFDEGLEIITSLLTNETTDFSGDHYTLTGARNEPKPIQRPHPPIVIGGTGPKRTLRSAARWAQHWNHPGASPDDWKTANEILIAHCADIGRDESEILRSVHLWYDPETGPAAFAEQAGAFAEAGVDLGIVYIQPPHTPDAVEEVGEAIRESGLVS